MPGLTESAIRDKAARAEREAAALRKNLRKRKEQARARGLEASRSVESERAEPPSGEATQADAPERAG